MHNSAARTDKHMHAQRCTPALTYSLVIKKGLTYKIGSLMCNGAPVVKKKFFGTVPMYPLPHTSPYTLL